ncbi:leucyl aminopeptidase [Arcanobacterium haemolyticum]|nr:leucyl aminopeptidase [Arcanobacterium haemolyticum]
MTTITTTAQTLPEGAALVVGVTAHNLLDSAVLTGQAKADVVDALTTLAASPRKETITKIASPALAGHQILAVHLGSDPSLADLRECAGAALRSHDLPSVVVVDFPHSDEAEFAAIAEGALLGAYRFDRYKSEKSAPIDEIHVVSALPTAEDGLDHVRILVDAQNAVRDLVNTPAGDLRTRELVDAAISMTDKAGVTARVWGEKELQEHSCGGLLGVGAGSTSESYLLRLEWAPANAERHVALVGKGITFDSGGMSLKTHAGLLDMKTDMTGAATVAAVVWAAARMNLPVRVTAWLCVAENMLSGSATRLGDVLHMSSGKTVEVTNTDAEGRLVLADGLTQAIAEKPDEVIDIATLTGAQMVALGNRCAGIMGTDALVAEIGEAAAEAGEAMWPMPLPEHLLSSLKSNVADIKNSGTRFGGMLVAGLFLKEFVGDVPWTHIDIAGPSYNTEEPWGYTGKGASGFAVRTLVQHLAK